MADRPGNHRRARAVLDRHRRLADIVLPATTALEREDIGYATRDPLHDRDEAA
jgi:anaerobic selenocysteine-containing dehydrogenase